MDNNFIEAVHYETQKPVRIRYSGGLITEVSEIRAMETTTDSLLIAPGLIDNQVNGYKGIDFSGEDIAIDDMRIAVDAIHRDGVTSFFPAILTNTHEHLLRNFRQIAATLNDSQIRDSVAGFHLEGPYLSREKGFYGCHPEGCIRNPSWEEFCRYQEAAEGNIRQITISPELEGAMEFIRQCTRNNIMVSIGHSNATASEIEMAVENGARLSTHLGNGCANMIDRHTNPIWPQLANDHLTPSIIADGKHLTREELKVFYKVKGPEKIFIISDITHISGMPPGKYNYLGNEVIYTDDGLIINPVLNCLAGASFPLIKGVETMIKDSICTPAEAMNLGTKNVSLACHLNDRGAIEPGKRADLILFSIKDKKPEISKVWVKGIEVNAG